MQALVEELRRLFDKYLEKVLEFRRENRVRELVSVPELSGVVSLCRLLDALATPQNGVSHSVALLPQKDLSART